MKVLITGASGFLGRCLTRYLRGHDVTVANRQTMDLSDVSQVRKFLQQQKFDWIINCAVSGRDSVRTIDPAIMAQNLTMFTNLYTNLDTVSQGLITFGSGAEYGLDRHVDQALETDIWNHAPTHSYGLSKNLISRMCSLHDRCWVIRVFGCFDPTEDAQRPIKKLSLYVQEQRPLIIEQDRWFDMISVTDLVKLIQYVMTGACGFQDINAVYGHKTRLSDILRLYCKINGHDPKHVQVLDSNGFSYTGDSSRLDLLDLPLLGLNRSLEMYGK